MILFLCVVVSSNWLTAFCNARYNPAMVPPRRWTVKSKRLCSLLHSLQVATCGQLWRCGGRGIVVVKYDSHFNKSNFCTY
jgi:hypothetical protein